MRAEGRDSGAAEDPGCGETIPGEMGRRESDLMEREGEQHRDEAERRSGRGKIAGRGPNGSRARGLLAVGARLARANVESDRDSTNGLAGRRGLDQDLARDRADRSQRSRDLVADVMAVRDEVESGAVSGRNGSRARGHRIEDARAVLSAEESGRDSISARAGRRELVQVSARDRADLLQESQGLAVDAIPARARALEEVRKRSLDGFRGLVARGMTKRAGRRRVGGGQLRRLARDRMRRN
jgi:hypothetical protein